MTGDGPIVGILLAGGSGSRFGGNKLAATLNNGESIGHCAARKLVDACGQVVVVIRGGDAPTRVLFEDLPVTLVECADASLGMAHTLNCGLNSASQAGGWLIALADMPFVLESTLSALVSAGRAAQKITVPYSEQRRGNPVFFPAQFRAKIQRLTGDEGARKLIAENPQNVTRIEVEDPGIHRDIDTRSDLESSLRP